MATRHYLKPLHRRYSSLFSSTKLSHTLKSPLHTLSQPQPPPQLENPTSNLHLTRSNLQPNNPFAPLHRHFSSYRRNKPPQSSEEEDDEDYDEDEDDEDDVEEDELSGEEEEEDDDGEVVAPKSGMKKVYTPEEKEKEAGEIGYRVIGPLDPTERPFKHREPYFAVVQIGSHQFKVSNGDCIYTEKLKFCDVNDKLILSKVLMVGSQSQTIIGRPILPDAVVQAVVEEHALDAKVIIFKKKRRKNYRRTKGHRQELTRLRITDIQGIEKPPKPEKPEKPERRERPEKVAVEGLEKLAVAA